LTDLNDFFAHDFTVGIVRNFEGNTLQLLLLFEFTTLMLHAKYS